jgi:hypothetical protein
MPGTLMIAKESLRSGRNAPVSVLSVKVLTFFIEVGTPIVEDTLIINTDVRSVNMYIGWKDLTHER